MLIEEITHNHFRKLIEDNYEAFNTNSLDKELFAIFFGELAYSTFIVPTFKLEGKDFLYLIGEKDDKVIPLFTDLAEYNKMFASRDDLTPKFYDFDYYLSAHMDLIINPTFEGVLINSDSFKNKKETPCMEHNFGEFTYFKDDLKLIANKIQNTEFKEYIKDKGVVYDSDFTKRLAKSILLAHSCCINDEITYFITPEGYYELYTSKGEINAKENSLMQVVNLEHFIEMLLRLDRKGFIINKNSDGVIVDRNTLILNFDEFKKEYDEEKFTLGLKFAFKV